MYYSLMRKMRLPFIDVVICYIEVSFKAGLTAPIIWIESICS